MLDEDFIDRWVDRLRQEVPDAVGIFLGGSQLRGDAGPHSDVDFDIVVPIGPRDEWPGWFDELHGRLVRISTWIRDVDSWLAAAEGPQEWAFHLACVDPLRLCWAADEAWRVRLDRTELVYPPGEPEVGHFEGEAGKIANAWQRADEPALRLAAQDLARAVVSILRPLNPRPPVRSRLEALRTLLAFDVVPAGYRDDMLTCLGLRGGTTGADIYSASRRLVLGVLGFVDGDGLLRRYLRQIFDATT